MEEQERMETGIKALRPLMISLPYNSYFILPITVLFCMATYISSSREEAQDT